MMRNRYDAKCNNCGVIVPVGRGNLVHADGKWRVSCLPFCTDADDLAFDAYNAHIDNERYNRFVAAFKKGESLKRTPGAWYDINLVKFHLPGTNAREVALVLSSREKYNYYGGYSTIGSVKELGDDWYTAESVYHIGN